jgi:hypothetical protein
MFHPNNRHFAPCVTASDVSKIFSKPHHTISYSETSVSFSFHKNKSFATSVVPTVISKSRPALALSAVRTFTFICIELLCINDGHFPQLQVRPFHQQHLYFTSYGLLLLARFKSPVVFHCFKLLQTLLCDTPQI